MWQEWQQLADNEAYWKGHHENGLLKAEYVRDFLLRLWFEEDMDVTIYELDFRPLFVGENPGGVFEALANKNRFRYIVGDYALIWPNPDTGAYDESAIDLAPECVRFFCERYGTKLKPVQEQAVNQPLPV